MITPNDKDRVLKWLCDNTEPEFSKNLPTRKLLNDVELSFNEVYAILNAFVRNDFIDSNSLRRNTPTFNIILRLNAFEFYQRGGFTLVEQQFMQNLQKLELELQELQSDFPEKTQTITSIISAITSVISLWR